MQRLRLLFLTCLVGLLASCILGNQNDASTVPASAIQTNVFPINIPLDKFNSFIYDRNSLSVPYIINCQNCDRENLDDVLNQDAVADICTYLQSKYSLDKVDEVWINQGDTVTRVLHRNPALS